ncbi:MAG: histidinol-phosphate transaminase, partial [Coriobacteriales bacterium]|nr:histidinol-phosphate transaminase [Coriobacteriales bacterium]
QVGTIHKLSSNESPFPPFSAALAAMQQSLATLNEYSDGSCHALTQLLAAHHGVPAEQIMVGNGSNELLDLIAQTCLDPGDEVVFCWPSFVVYRSSAQLAAATSVELPLRDDGAFDLAAQLAAITPKTKIVYVCSPNNPSGSVVAKADFEAFLAAVPAHVLVVVDNAYFEFIDGEDTIDPMDYYDGIRPLVVLRTFSKMYALAGARVGYGIAPAALVEMVHKVREPFNVNTVAQAGAAASLGDTAEVERRRASNTEGKQRLCSCFERLGLAHFRSAANFVWVEVPNAPDTFEQLLRRGIIVRPFAGTNGLRVGVGDAAGVGAIIAAFEELFSAEKTGTAETVRIP